MKKMLFGLMAVAICSGQNCGTPVETGPTNVCDRSYYNETYRVGVTPPPNSTFSNGALTESTDLNARWMWNDFDPAIEFALVVVKPTQETTLAEFKQVTLDELNKTDTSTIESQEDVTLDSGSAGWRVAVSSTENPGEIRELVMAVSNGRLVTYAVNYPDTLSAEQIQQIRDILLTLCADKP